MSASIVDRDRTLLQTGLRLLPALIVASITASGCGKIVPIEPSDAGVSDAAEPPDAPGEPPVDAAPPPPDAPDVDAAPDPNTITLTHSESEVVQGGRTFFCGDEDFPPHHTDNSYIRVFDLTEFGIVGDFRVSSVRFGVELTESPDGEQPARLFFYTLPRGSNLRYENLDLVEMFEFTVPDQELKVFEVATEVQIPAGAQLVVELAVPTGEFADRFFYTGFNSLGQSAPTFFAAPPCEDFEPTNLANLDAADAHLVLSVRGLDVAAPDAGVTTQ